jgi:hypothetical protein
VDSFSTEDAAERQGGDKQRTEDAFHGTLSSVGGCGIRLLPVSGGTIRRTDAAEARFAQKHERALFHAAAEVSGLGVRHDLTRVADPLQIASDDFVERCSFQAGDLSTLLFRGLRILSGCMGENSVAIRCGTVGAALNVSIPNRRRTAVSRYLNPRLYIVSIDTVCCSCDV